MSFSASTAICIAAFVLLASAEDVPLPKGIKTCKRGSDDYSSCLRLALQEAWPIVVEGVPEWGIEKLDPLLTEQQESTYESGESIRGKIAVKNVYTYGLGKARFLAVRPEYVDDMFRLQIDYEMPKLFMEGEYKAEGVLGPMKMGGKGFFNISLEDVKDTWDIQGHVENDRWVIEHFRTLPEVGNMRVWFTDLFNGNEELNQLALKFVNEYWPVLYRQMLPVLTAAWDKHLTEMLNEIFSRVSFEKLFP